MKYFLVLFAIVTILSFTARADETGWMDLQFLPKTMHFDENTPDVDLGGVRSTHYWFYVDTEEKVALRAYCGANEKGRNRCLALTRKFVEHLKWTRGHALVAYHSKPPHETCRENAGRIDQLYEIALPPALRVAGVNVYGRKSVPCF